MDEFALLAGSAAATIFMLSQLPMLAKACRTRNLTSYSFANIGLANLGNLLYAVYVFHVPLGPVWAIHGFNSTTSGLMLFWYLRYRRRIPVALGSTAASGSPAFMGSSDRHTERSRTLETPWSAAAAPDGRAGVSARTGPVTRAHTSASAAAERSDPADEPPRTRVGRGGRRNGACPSVGAASTMRR